MFCQKKEKGKNNKNKKGKKPTGAVAGLPANGPRRAFPPAPRRHCASPPRKR